MIYLDNNATTRPLPEVVEATREAMERFYGNPSSKHPLGTEARRTLEQSREIAASILHAQHTSQIVFTSGGTESINLAFSLLLAPVHRQIIVSSVEHNAVLSAAKRWAAGRTVCEVPVNTNGILDLEYLDAALKSAPALVSLMLANNETGILSDIPVAAKLCRKHGAMLHVDAVQALGKIPLSLDSLDCDAVSFSAHKLHGPKGCGLLLIRSLKGVFQPLLAGHQELNLRGGTENLPAILGSATALKCLQQGLADMPRIALQRDSLEQTILATIPGSAINGARSPRLPQTSNIYFPARNAADLVSRLATCGVCVSAGAACSTGGRPSHVLKAMGLSEEQASGSVRISFSRFTTAEETADATRFIIETYRSTLATS